MNNKLQVIVSIAGLFLTIILIVFSVCVIEDKKGSENIEDTAEVSVETTDKFIPKMSGWVDVNEANLMKEPSESSDVADTLFFNEKITYVDYNDKWGKTSINDEDVYVLLSDIENHETKSHYYEIPTNTGFKSFMDYSSITLTSSLQYKIQNSYATTGDYGIRMVGNRYCIALGSHFSNDIGQYVDLILKNGTVIPCILSEQKDDMHTDYNNIITVNNGCLSEFIVDTNSLNNDVLKYGDISYCNDEWDNPVVSIKIYDKNLFN